MSYVIASSGTRTSKLPNAVCALCLSLIVASGVASATIAQQRMQNSVVVHVLSETGEPIPGAMVRLVNDRGQTVARALSTDAGFATIRAATPGTYQFAIERLGYDAWLSKDVEIKGSSSNALQFRVPVRAIKLDSLSVSAKNRCAAPATVGQAVAGAANKGAQIIGRFLGVASKPVLSKEVAIAMLPRTHAIAMAALRGSSVSPGRSYLVEAVRERPRYDGDERLSTSVDTVQETRSRPLASQPPELLAIDGFIAPRNAPEGEPAYHLPTSEVITSEVFAVSHCFRVVVQPDSGWLGLRFDPLPGNLIPDVRGVVWLDTVHTQVVKIEFNYTQLGEFLRDHEFRHAFRAASNRSTQIFRDARRREQFTNPDEIRCQRSGRIQVPDPNEDQFGGVIEYGFVRPDLWGVTAAFLRWPILQGTAADGGTEKRSGSKKCLTISYTHIVSFKTTWRIRRVTESSPF